MGLRWVHDLFVTFFTSQRFNPFYLRFWILGKIVFVEGKMKYSTVVLILLKIIKKWVNFHGF